MSGIGHHRVRHAVRRGRGCGPYSPDEDGFTLPEVMVALVIVSILAISGFTLMRSSFETRARLQATDQVLMALQQAQTLLRRDLIQMVERVAQDEYGQAQDFVFYGTDDPRLPFMAFTRTGWENPEAGEARSDLQYVEYWYVDGRVERRTPLRVDPTSDTPVVSRTVLSGVTDLRVEFGDGESWTEEWIWGGTSRRAVGFAPPIVVVWLELEDLGDIRFVMATPFDGDGGGG